MGNPIVNGLMHAMSLANTMQRAKLDQEQLRMEKRRDQRREEFDNLKTHVELLNAGAVPVGEDGRYGRDIQVPTSLPFELGEPTRSVSTRVPVEQARVVPSMGQQMYYPTLQERFENEEPILRRKNEIEAIPQILRSREQHQLNVDLEARKAGLLDERADEQRQFQAAENEKARTSREGIAEQNRKSSEARTILNVRARIAAAKKSGGAIDDNAVQAVIDNPALWDRLTKVEATKLGPELARRGFDFGKPLSESAIKSLAESRSAIASLQDLRKVLQENEQYIGPVTGLQALSPWSDARKAQARIDLVKQRVGKTLEGGVLRKEDEEKYKRILATITDEKDTAFSKLDGLVHTLESDISKFEDEQRRAGRRVISPGQDKGGATSSALPGVGTMYNGEKVLKVTRVK